MMDLTPYLANPNEKPLDVIKPDGGFAGIFRTITIVGDSLSSGELEGTSEDGKREIYDYYEYSWGEFIGRATGAKINIFACGGMNALSYIENWGEKNGVWDESKASQAYIIALGCNDLSWCRHELGSAADFDAENPENSKRTFAGGMARIIARYKEISPKARFFLITMPREADKSTAKPEDWAKWEGHRRVMYELAELFEYTYVIDLFEHGPIYNDEFRKNFYLAGHLNVSGYLLTANMVMSYMDYIIRNNPEDFRQAGFIGKGHHHYGYKW